MLQSSHPLSSTSTALYLEYNLGFFNNVQSQYFHPIAVSPSNRKYTLYPEMCRRRIRVLPYSFHKGKRRAPMKEENEIMIKKQYRRV